MALAPASLLFAQICPLIRIHTYLYTFLMAEGVRLLHWCFIVTTCSYACDYIACTAADSFKFTKCNVNLCTWRIAAMSGCTFPGRGAVFALLHVDVPA